MKMQKCPKRIKKGPLEKEAQKENLPYRGWNKDKIWNKLPQKTQKKLEKNYCLTKGAGLEKDVENWMKRKLRCDETYAEGNKQKLPGKIRKHQVDVIGLKTVRSIKFTTEGYNLVITGEGSKLISPEAYIAECKGQRVDDHLVNSIIGAFRDIIEKSNKLPKKYNNIKINKFMLISSKGFTEAAKKTAKKGKIGGGYALELYEFAGGGMNKIK